MSPRAFVENFAEFSASLLTNKDVKKSGAKSGKEHCTIFRNKQRLLRSPLYFVPHAVAHWLSTSVVLSFLRGLFVSNPPLVNKFLDDPTTNSKLRNVLALNWFELLCHFKALRDLEALRAYFSYLGREKTNFQMIKICFLCSLKGRNRDPVIPTHLCNKNQLSGSARIPDMAYTHTCVCCWSLLNCFTNILFTLLGKCDSTFPPL